MEEMWHNYKNSNKSIKIKLYNITKCKLHKMVTCMVMVIYVKIIGMSCRNLSFNNILYHISSLHSHLIDITQLKKITFTCEDIMKKIYITNYIFTLSTHTERI